MARHYKKSHGPFAFLLKIIMLLLIAAVTLFVVCRFYPERFPPEAVHVSNIVSAKAQKLTTDTIIKIINKYRRYKSVDTQEQIENTEDAVLISEDVISLDFPHTEVVDKRPILALVVDDGGNAPDLAKRVATLDIPLTWAIIPYTKFAKSTEELAKAGDIPYLLHLPMQAVADKNSGQYLIGEGMSRSNIRRIISEALETLPNAIGLNNHRGSLATSSKDIMVPIMEELKLRDLLFLDSHTSNKSVAYDVAKASGITSLQNRGFLDGSSDKDEIEKKFNEIVKQATKRGDMIAICHFRPATVLFLEKLNGNYIDMPVRLVTLPEMAEILSKAEPGKEIK